MSDATIVIYAKDVAHTFGVAKHGFAIFTFSDGTQQIIRGGPKNENFFKDDLQVVKSEYTEVNNNIHHDFFQKLSPLPHTTIFTGTDAEVKNRMDQMWDIGQNINAANFDYKLPIFGCPVDICHVQNSNTVLRIMVERAGLQFQVPLQNGKPVLMPGVDGELRHTILDRAINNYLNSFELNGEHTCTNHQTDWSQITLDTVTTNDPHAAEQLSQEHTTPKSSFPLGKVQLQVRTDGGSNLDANNLENAWATTGLGFYGSNYLATMDPRILNADGATNTIPSSIFSDDIRPGAKTLVEEALTPKQMEMFYGKQSPANSAHTLTEIFNRASKIPNVDPLVIKFDNEDLSADDLTHWSEHEVLFDIDADGVKEKVSWIKPNMGFLVADLNRNGQIDSAAEIFSEHFYPDGNRKYSHGFEALKILLDSNNDDIINVHDAKYNELQVWHDKNSDGKTDDGELKTLAEMGIVALDIRKYKLLSYQLKSNNVIAKLKIGIAEDSILHNFTLNAEECIMFRNKLVHYPGGVSKEQTEYFHFMSKLVEAFPYVASGRQTFSANELPLQAKKLLCLDFTQDLDPKYAYFLKDIYSITLSFDPNYNIQNNVDSESILKTIAKSELSTIVGKNQNGQTLDLNQLKARAVIGSDGNDVLIGDESDNWLVGSKGKDEFHAGAGNDILIIDDEDDPEKIDCGEGEDVVYAISKKGIIFNMGTANAETFIGSQSNDFVVATGIKAVFIDGQDGDDYIIGSANNDVLSGGQGDDVILGRAGNDIIRGHAGNDKLFGGEGDDYIDGGADDDELYGEEGDDILRPGIGTNYVDGGTGINTVEFEENYTEYDIAKTDLSSYEFKITHSSTNAVSYVKNCTIFNFRNVSNIKLNELPFLPKPDLLQYSAPKMTINSGELIKNDLSLNGQRLFVRELTDAKGLSIEDIQKAAIAECPNVGEVILSFTVSIAYNTPIIYYKTFDCNGKGLFVTNNQQTVDLKTAVYLYNTNLPSDPGIMKQQYLNDLNIFPVWEKYSGKGVKVAVAELGNFDKTHPDLQSNFCGKFTFDPMHENEIHNNHATKVAGVIAASKNGEGVIGIAYKACLSSISTGSHLTKHAVKQFLNYDIVNLSISNTRFGTNDLLDLAEVTEYMNNIVHFGGLRDSGHFPVGIVVVFSAGNYRALGGNSNYYTYNSSPTVITVGGIHRKSDLGKAEVEIIPFSDRGANILVSAPTDGIYSSSMEVRNQHGTVFSTLSAYDSGTSFAAPIVSGIVALMKEANPFIHYRDIQRILAYTATKIDPNGSDWHYNSAKDWNNGGLHVSHDYGFGQVNAEAAVAVSETWINRNNPDKVTSDLGTRALSGLQSKKFAYASKFSDDAQVERVQLILSLSIKYISTINITLTSPYNTTSLLLDKPGVMKNTYSNEVSLEEVIQWSFSSSHFLGENLAGRWSFIVSTDNDNDNANATPDSYKMHFFLNGTQDNIYIFTPESKDYCTAERSIIRDSTGIDSINSAAINTDVQINLAPGAQQQINNCIYTIAADTEIENALTGKGNDIIKGNNKANILYGGEGNDQLFGFSGRDILVGGKGNNELSGGNDADLFVIHLNPSCTDLIKDFQPDIAGEKINLVGFGSHVNFANLKLQQIGNNVSIAVVEQILLLENTNLTNLGADHFLFDNHYDFYGNSGENLAMSDVLARVIYGYSSPVSQEV